LIQICKSHIFLSMIRYLSFALFDHDKHFPKADFKLFKRDCVSQCWLGEEQDLSTLQSCFFIWRYKKWNFLFEFFLLFFLRSFIWPTHFSCYGDAFVKLLTGLCAVIVIIFSDEW